MEFTIYSIGDFEILERVLVALSLIMDNGDYRSMIRIGFLIGVLGIFIGSLLKGARSIDFHVILVCYLIWGTMFVPTARVIVEDTYTGRGTIVDDVPLGPALAGSIISKVGVRLGQLFEMAYDPLAPRGSGSEFTESLKVLTNLRYRISEDNVWLALNEENGGGWVDLRRSWHNYIKNCTLRKIDFGIMSPSDLMSLPYQEALKTDIKLFGAQIFTSPGNPDGSSPNCADAWAELNNRTHFNGAETIEAVNAVLGQEVSNLRPGQSAVNKTTNAIQSMLDGALSAQDFMKMAILDPVLDMAAEGKYKDNKDEAAAIMINQAIQQRNTQWAAEQSMFMTTVRPMMAFFEAFVYAIAPIMAFVIVLGTKGIQLGLKYFTFLIWMQLWTPILTIINLYIHTAATRKLDAYSNMIHHNWDSFYALDAGADVMQTWIATGGMLAASTPAIALMLIYGSAMTATHLAGRLQGGDHVNEKMVSPDVRNAPALATFQSKYQGDSVIGTKVTGSEVTTGNYDSGAQFGHIEASARALRHSTIDTATSGLAKAFNNSENASDKVSLMKGIGNLVQSGEMEGSGWTQGAVQQFMKQHQISDDYKEHLTGATTLAGNLGGKADIDGMVGALIEAGFPALRAGALAGLLKKAASNPAANDSVFTPGGAANDAAPSANDGRYDNRLAREQGDPSRKSGNGGNGGKGVNSKGGGSGLFDLTGTVSLQSGSGLQSSAGTGRSSSDSQSSGESTAFSDDHKATFLKSLSSMINGEYGDSYDKAASIVDTENISKSLSDVVAKDETYQEASTLTSKVGSSYSKSLTDIGLLAAGNKDALQLLNSGFGLHATPAAQTQAASVARVQKSLGYSETEANAIGQMVALTNPANFQGDTQKAMAGAILAANVVEKATGVNFGDLDKIDPGKNKGLDTPNEKEAAKVRENSGELTGQRPEALRRVEAAKTDTLLAKGSPTNLPINPNEGPLQSHYQNNSNVRIEEGKQAAMKQGMRQLNDKAEDINKFANTVDQPGWVGKVSGKDESLRDAFRTDGDTVMTIAINGTDVENAANMLATDLSEDQRAIYNIGTNQLELSPAQAAVLATHGDDKYRPAALQLLNQENATLQFRDDGQKTRKITEDSQELTESMATILDTAYMAGGNAGSYLSDIQAYNEIKEGMLDNFYPNTSPHPK